MSFRKLLNDYPGLTTAISIGLLLVALGVIGFQVWARSQEPRSSPPPKVPDRELDPHIELNVNSCGVPPMVAG